MSGKKKELSIEETFAKLDGMIEKLQDTETSLEEAFTTYQAGMALLKEAGDKIDLVEKKVMVLSEEGEQSEF